MADNFSFTPEQLASTQTFFAGNPTPDQIYQVALQNQLSPEQLSQAWSQATGQDYNTGIAAVNQYLGTTGKTLPGGFVPQFSFDETAYLQNKLAQLQATPGALTAAQSAGWSGSTPEELKAFMAQVGMTPEEHYYKFGVSEGVNPTAFNEQTYLGNKMAQLQSSPEALKSSGFTGTTAQDLKNYMAQVGITPEEHYYKYGLTENVLPIKYDPSQQAQFLVDQAYKNLGRTGFGTEASQIDQPSYENWINQVTTGAIAPQDLSKVIEREVQNFVAAKPEDPTAKYMAEYVVKDAFKDAVGRDPTAAETAALVNQVQSKQTGISGLTYQIAQNAKELDRIAAQKYLGQEIWGSEDYLKGTKGAGYQDIVDFVTKTDPSTTYQAAQKYDVSPEEIVTAFEKKGITQPTIEEIQNQLNQGKASYETKFNDVVNSTFGSPEELQGIKTLLYNNFKSQVEGLKVSDKQKETILQNVTADDVFNKQFNSANFVTKPFEEIVQSIQESGLNKYQEAQKVASLAQNVYGLSETDAVNVAKNLVEGKDTDPKLKEIFKKLLKTGLTPEIQNEILQDAAVRKPDSKFWQDNPNLKQIYTPLDKQSGSSGQYGYYNNAPVLNADFASSALGDKNQRKLNLGSETDFGWQTNSKYAGEIKRGPALFDIDFSDKNEVEKAVQIENGLKNGTVYSDPEGGGYYKINPDGTVDSIGVVQSENTQKGYNPYQENTIEKLQQAATQIGLDPNQYKSAGDLYDSIEAKTNNLYQVTGRAAGWDPQVAAKSGINITDGSRGGVNHASVLYRQVGDKLVAVSDPKSFAFDDPKTSGVKRQLAKLGPIVPIAMMALSAATGGLSSLLSPITAPLTATMVEAGLPQLLASSLTNAAVSGGFSALTGGDWEKAGLGSLASNLIGGSMGFTENPNTGEIQKSFSPGYGEDLLDAVGYSGTDISNLIDPRTLARLGGTYAASLATGADPSRILINQAISQGIRSLPGTSTTKSSFGDDLYSFDNATKDLEFTLSPEQKASLEDEYNRIMAGGNSEIAGITGLSLGQEDWMIDALKDIVPLFMAKGLTKLDATMLASNLLGAAAKGEG